MGRWPNSLTPPTRFRGTSFPLCAQTLVLRGSAGLVLCPEPIVFSFSLLKGHHAWLWPCPVLASPPLMPCSVHPPQERQRLETILNLCAEYSRADGGPEAGELPSIREAAAALALTGRRPSRGLPGATQVSGRSSEEPGGAGPRLWESVERSDEENLKEERSSTESAQQEVGSHLEWVGVGGVKAPWGSN